MAKDSTITHQPEYETDKRAPARHDEAKSLPVMFIATSEPTDRPAAVSSDEEVASNRSLPRSNTNTEDMISIDGVNTNEGSSWSSNPDATVPPAAQGLQSTNADASITVSGKTVVIDDAGVHGVSHLQQSQVVNDTDIPMASSAPSKSAVTKPAESMQEQAAEYVVAELVETVASSQGMAHAEQEQAVEDVLAEMLETVIPSQKVRPVERERAVEEMLAEMLEEINQSQDADLVLPSSSRSLGDEIVVKQRRQPTAASGNSKRKKAPASGNNSGGKRKRVRTEAERLSKGSEQPDQRDTNNSPVPWVRRSTRVRAPVSRSQAGQKVVQDSVLGTLKSKPRRSRATMSLPDNAVNPTAPIASSEDDDELSSALSEDDLNALLTGVQRSQALPLEDITAQDHGTSIPGLESAVMENVKPSIPSLKIRRKVQQSVRHEMETPSRLIVAPPQLPSPSRTGRNGRTIRAPDRYGDSTNPRPKSNTILVKKRPAPAKTRPAQVDSKMSPPEPTTSRLAQANSTQRKQTSKPSPKVHRQIGERRTPDKQVLPFGLLTPPGTQGSVADHQLDIDTPTEVNTPTTIVSPEVERLATVMCHKHPIEAKPPPSGVPLVWAESRQALTETVPYFKKPQGGCHTKDRHVYSFMFDAVTHARAYMDQDVIVARAGGAMESDSSGQMRQGRDQSIKDSQVQAVLNDRDYRNPLIIIAGDRNIDCPTRLPHKYCVLGWYKPTDVWAEKTLGKGHKMWTTIMYRFERLGSGMADSNKPWFAPQDIAPLDRTMAGQLKHHSCDACGEKHPQIYLIGWICLNEDCVQFWLVNGRFPAPGGSLLFNPAWLLARLPWSNEMEPASVKQGVHDIGKILGDNLTKINTRGICCPECGRCNSRRLFAGWVCENPQCAWKYFPEHRIIMPAALHTPWDNLGDGPTLSRARHGAGVNVESVTLYGYKVTTWTIDGVDGKIIHAAANRRINQQSKGPDEMLIALQSEDLGLERRRFRAARTSHAQITKSSKNEPDASKAGEVDVVEDADGEDEGPKKSEFEDGDMMAAFSMNYGMPYKFIANGASMSFDEAPWPVKRCRSVLDWAARTFLGREGHGKNEDVGFNEQLIFAYMEGQKLEYHDDGETGLGPSIGTLSLGGKSTMQLRMKMKHYVGCSKQGILTPDRPLPSGFGGRAMYEKRLAAWSELQSLQQRDVKGYMQRLKTIPKELGLYEKRSKKAEDSIVIPLNHGDIILMHGYDIQKYFEHKVVAEDHLRFALTCRTINPDHLQPDEMPTYEVGPDEDGYEGDELGQIYGLPMAAS